MLLFFNNRGNEKAFQKYLNLKNNYDFYPKYMVIDFSKAEENAIRGI